MPKVNQLIRKNSYYATAYRDYHGFWNLCGFWVGYSGVRVGVMIFVPLLNPYPQDGLAGFPVGRTCTHGNSPPEIFPYAETIEM